jgi:AcrR family transcriptional regulator
MMMVRAAQAHRPRVEGEREDEILDATVELLMEVGYDRLTMDAVAKRARASKATLYRRWETKASLVAEALVRAKTSPHVDQHDTGTLRGDLLATFCGHEGIGAAATGVLGAVITAVSTDPEFARLFRENFIAPKVAVTRAMYERAQERGEISTDVDVDLVAPALPAILMHRAFLLGDPIDDAMIERVVDHVILPAVQHPSCGAGTHHSTHELTPELTTHKARKTR